MFETQDIVFETHKLVHYSILIRAPDWWKRTPKYKLLIWLRTSQKTI